MYTSVQNEKKPELLREAAVYAFVSLFCAVFGFVYTSLGYGQTSLFMTFMFVPPLLLGAVPSYALYRTGIARAAARAPSHLWNSGVALMTVGCLVRGVINISGRDTQYDIIYWMSGAAFLAAALICLLRGRGRGRKRGH